MKREEKVKDPNKVGIGKLLLWCANGASSAIQVILIGFLTLYCTNALGLDAALVGTVLMVSKIFDGMTDLVAGYIVDKTNTKLGRGRPYDLCIIGLWITTWLCFSVPADFSVFAKCAWIFICYSLCQSVFKTMMNAAGMPYMVRAFNNEQAYVTISSIGGLITTFAVIIFNVIFPMFYAKVINSPSGWSSLVAYISIPLCIIGMLRFFFVPEKYVVEDTESHHTTLKDVVLLLKSNKYIYPILILQFIVGISSNFSSVTSYYFLYIVGNVEISGTMSMLAIFSMMTMALYPAILKKISTRQLVQYSLLMSIASGAILFLAGKNLVLIAIGSIINGMVALPCSYMGSLFVVECADYNEWQGRVRLEGTINSVVGFGNKIGTAFGSFLVGVALSAAGFNGAATVQPDSAIWMIRACFSIIPMAFYLLGALCLKFYKIDKLKGQMSKELAERRAALNAADQISSHTL